MPAKKSPESTVSGPSAADHLAVAALTQRVVAAWIAHDADAFAEVFTQDATMILPGLFKKGRDEIRAHMAAAFKGPYKGTRVTGKPIDIRLFSKSAGVLITEGGVLAPGESDVPAAQAIRASWLVIKQGGHWRLAAYQNSPRDSA